MGFIALLILVTMSLAGSAAFFSIYGLAQIFAGSFWPVVIMASSLEAGKLIAASYAYRYWDVISALMKTYLVSAVLVLMLITSAGIFGFLSTAHQQDVLPMKMKKQQIALIESEKVELEQLKQERLARKQQIDHDISALPNNYVTGRQRLLESYKAELDQLQIDVASYTESIRKKTTELSELKSSTLELEAHVGPIIFIAEAFNQEVDDATKWLILLIIFVFDPLAVVLTIGANMALVAHGKPTKKISREWVKENVLVSEEFHASTPEPYEPGALPEDEPTDVVEESSSEPESEDTTEPKPAITSVKQLPKNMFEGEAQQRPKKPSRVYKPHTYNP